MQRIVNETDFAKKMREDYEKWTYGLPKTHWKAMELLRNAIGRNPVMEEIADVRKLRVLKRKLRNSMRTKKEYKAAEKMVDKSANYLKFALKMLKKRVEAEEYARNTGPDGKKIVTEVEQELSAFRKLNPKAATRVASRLERQERKFIAGAVLDMGHSYSYAKEISSKQATAKFLHDYHQMTAEKLKAAKKNRARGGRKALLGPEEQTRSKRRLPGTKVGIPKRRADSDEYVVAPLPRRAEEHPVAKRQRPLYSTVAV